MIEFLNTNEAVKIQLYFLTTEVSKTWIYIIIYLYKYLDTRVRQLEGVSSSTPLYYHYIYGMHIDKATE